eukprot:GSMAST32.ASY1.ANO1.1635.1 assembled CDS
MAAKHGNEADLSEPSTNIVVCDNGTGFVKCGYAGDNFPRHEFASMVGHIGDIKLKDVMVGDEAEKARKYLEIRYPVDEGIVKHWEDMEHFVCQGNRIMLTEAPLNPKKNKEKFCEYMFEKYGFASMQVQTQAMLTLYAQGLLTGVVLDSGDGVTHVVAVYDGYVPQQLTRRLNLAGRHVTRHLIEQLQMRGYVPDFETVRRVKEDICYVAYDVKKERQLAEETTACIIVMKEYKLPDGRIITAGRERFEVAELMFTPENGGVTGDGVSDMIMDLYKHIVLSGGSTMYVIIIIIIVFFIYFFVQKISKKNMKTRYLNEILHGDKRKLSKFRLGIEDPPRRKNMYVFLFHDEFQIFFFFFV